MYLLYILQEIQYILNNIFYKLLPFHIRFLSVHQIVRNNNDLRSIQI